MQPMLVVCDQEFYCSRFLKHVVKRGEDAEPAGGWMCLSG